uniref:Uncharacterized protein n=1 Tax=Fusarium oxysporum (strain Fo5176) TaxID=660025 RepID=A0A0D2XWB6_FUSOF
MSEYYNPGIPPEDENRNQTGYQGQNPGQYQDQNNGIQRNQWNPSLSYPGSIEPGRVGFAPNAGPATWGQQPQLHRMPQEHEMEQIHPRNQWHAMKQTNQRNQRNQMQNMYQIPPHIANPAPAPAPAPASWYGYSHLLHGMDLANMSAIELLNRFPIFFGQPDPAWSNTGNNSDACAGSVSVQNQQHGGQHIAVYPNGSHSNGGYLIHGHATPPPPPSQPSPAAPSTGGRRKRGRAASPNTTAPAPKRTRNLAPNASGAEGDNANSSRIPDPTPNTTSTPSRQPQRTRKRKADIDEEDDDDEDDLPSDPRPPKKPRRRPGATKKDKVDDAEAGNSRRNRKKEDNELVDPGTICNFCATHPAAYAANPVCDWEQVPNRNGPEIYNIECSNCANYRSRNKDHTELAKTDDHMCRVRGPITPLINFEYKSCRHHKAKCDPMSYDKPGCIDRAKVAGKENKRSYSPGHLYYLALGYGPDGVDDIKDGRQVEHWIGPAAPVYGLTDIKDRPRHYRYIADVHRHHRPPGDAIPPVTTPAVLLEDTTAEQLRGIITELWSNSQPPKNDLQAYQKVWKLLRDNQNLQMSQAGVEINLPGPTRSVRSFQGGPVLIDIERIHNRMLPSVYGYPNATQSQGTPQILPNPPYQPPVQYRDYHQQNASAPKTQLYPHPAAQQPNAHTQQPQPIRPSQDPADQHIHSRPEKEVYGQSQQGQQMSPNQVPPYQQDCGNLDQQRLDTHSQHKGQPRDPADQRENEEVAYDRYVANTLLRALQSPPDQGIADGQETEDVGPGQHRLFADDSAILALPGAHDVENDQQEPLTGPQPQDQPQDGIDKFKEMSYTHLLNYKRSRVNRGERWHNPQTSRGGKKPFQERMARGNRVPKNANNQDAFNPFLGFTFGPDQKPRFKGKANGLTLEAPLRDVLGDVPYEEKGERTWCYCAEPGECGRGKCGSWDTGEQGQATCQSSAHRNTAPGYFPVCNDCTRGNVKYLFQHEHNPITEGELLSMRAYLCNDCAGQMSSGAPNAAQNQAVGARRVYGIAADAKHYQNMQKPVNDPSQAAKFISNTEALTGCSCANRMLGTSLCRFHRLYYAEEVMKHSALMQEWRLSRFKKANDGNNQPKAIDKPLWNLNIGRELLDPRREITPGRVLGEEVSV